MDRGSLRRLNLLPDRNLRRPNRKPRRPRLVIQGHIAGEDLAPSLKPLRLDSAFISVCLRFRLDYYVPPIQPVSDRVLDWIVITLQDEIRLFIPV